MINQNQRCTLSVVLVVQVRVRLLLHWQILCVLLIMKLMHFFFVNRNGEYNFKPELLHAAHSVCEYWVKRDLGRSFSVVVSNTSTTEKEVKVYQDIAKEHNANFVSLIVENRNDTMSVHDVLEDVLQKQRKRFSVKL